MFSRALSMLADSSLVVCSMCSMTIIEVLNVMSSVLLTSLQPLQVPLKLCQAVL